MNPENLYEQWKRQRQDAVPSEGFAERVMQSLPTRPSWVSLLAVAAGVLLVVLGHAGTVGLLYVAMEGVVR
jgi:hypothetical protein